MKKILIIEDDQIVANIYRNKFSVEGFQVEIASDGPSGLETLRSFQPDAVILDLMLPGMTGVEVMKKVRALPEYQKLPIIVFSNTYLTNMVQEAWKAGATKCLSKANCTPKQLIEVVRNSVASNGATTTAAMPAESQAKSSPAPHPEPPQPSPAHRRPADIQTNPSNSFLESLPATLTSLRTLLQSLIKAEDETGRAKQIHEMYRRIHGLTSNAGFNGMLTIAHMADALEALLKELYEKPKNINASTLRTVASAVDFLAILFERRAVLDQGEKPATNVLVVDDEAISRRAVTYALEKAKIKCVAVEDPQVAYQLLAEKPFDLVFLDVDMPGMTGYELCSKLRNLSAHKKTPVVFVTGLNDLESRANSMVSGGNDFIAKPFLFIELAVKALVYLLRGQIPAPKKVAS
ncbi:MAG TPA: response regulator [Candidatus Limnocylindrales bacterium]|jgi:CheY-like chemotaxis protein|nr:response regulator [Candidatus Limnocylindrales bacterium]